MPNTPYVYLVQRSAGWESEYTEGAFSSINRALEFIRNEYPTPCDRNGDVWIERFTVNAPTEPGEYIVNDDLEALITYRRD